MGYVVGEILVYILIAALIGLLIGWLLWYRKWHEGNNETADTSTSLATRTTERPISALGSVDGQITDLKDELEAAKSAAASAIEEMCKERDRAAALSAQLADLEGQLATVRSELTPAVLAPSVRFDSAAVPSAEADLAVESEPEPEQESDSDAVAAAVAAGTASFLDPEPVEELRASPDELQQIKGVGPYLEALLNRNGIYTFRQIAALTPQGVADLDSRLESFKGRIGRDNWLPQATELDETNRGTSTR
ncbi:MAG: hypothetical protein GY925_05285 [Actinomycetia bacterium]|nr:hypothetical protein [Actinomycetes bacterium]